MLRLAWAGVVLPGGRGALLNETWAQSLFLYVVLLFVIPNPPESVVQCNLRVTLHYTRKEPCCSKLFQLSSSASLLSFPLLPFLYPQIHTWSLSWALPSSPLFSVLPDQMWAERTNTKCVLLLRLLQLSALASTMFHPSPGTVLICQTIWSWVSSHSWQFLRQKIS